MPYCQMLGMLGLGPIKYRMPPGHSVMLLVIISLFSTSGLNFKTNNGRPETRPETSETS